MARAALAAPFAASSSPLRSATITGASIASIIPRNESTVSAVGNRPSAAADATTRPLILSSPCSLPSGKNFPVVSRHTPTPVIGLSMVNPFHLHNCGNSLDIVELLFPFLPLSNPFLSNNFHNSNHLECIRLRSLWHFVCS